MFGLRGLHPDREITGFETAFAEIAPRLASRGHTVTIYARRGAHTPDKRPARDAGVDLVYLPSPGGKNIAAPLSTLMAVLRAFFTGRHDVWFFVNVGMGHHAALARLSGKPVVMNVDGLDWARGKWGPLARAYFRSAARSAVRFCTELVTDAVAMQEYYRQHFQRDSTMIAYGADVEESVRPELLNAIGVEPREYYLIVSRFIPENSLEEMLHGFSQSAGTRRLLVVGSASYEDAFQRRLRALAESDRRIMLAGAVSDQALMRELWCNCRAYFHGHTVGGTNPALLRAMGYGSCVLARDTVFNREVLADTGLYFADATDVTDAIGRFDGDSVLLADMRMRAQARIREHYSWTMIADAYERLFRDVTRR